MAEEQPPAASDFVDDEAEESGAEGVANDAEDGAADADPSGNLDGFIADEPVAAANAADDDGSDSGDDEPQELGEEDLAMLEEAGIDVTQVNVPVKRSRDGEGDEEGAPPPQRPKVDGDEDDMADLFGPDDDAPPPAAKPAGGDDDFDFSEGESVDGFIVEDTGSKRRRLADEAAELDVNEDMLAEIVDIFGTTDVLRPIDEVEAAREGKEESAGPMPATPAMPMTPSSIVPHVGPAHAGATHELDIGTDPDLQVRNYDTQADLLLETTDLPERWVQMYMLPFPELLNEKGERVWTEEEHLKEARWIYREAFFDLHQGTGYERDATQECIVELLDMLHTKKLEPIHVVAQYGWRYRAVFQSDDLWRVMDYDQRWQSVWLLYTRVQKLVAKHREDVHLWIQDRFKDSNKLFDDLGAEIILKDMYDWFAIRHPDSIQPEGLRKLGESETDTMSKMRNCRFDEKLGIKDSVDEVTLKAFGITPEELGRNIGNNEQLFKPATGDEDDHTVQQICEEHVTDEFKSWQAVQDAIILFLSRLIASDPRVRNWVRKNFMNMCAVSTSVTPQGKSEAYEAAQAFRASYKAFHIVNRPAASFPTDELFLDILDLERRGFLRLDYSLIFKQAPKEGDENEDAKYAYKLVMVGHEAEDVGKDKQRMEKHKKRQEEKFEPVLEDDVKDWQWCESVKPRLYAAARACEIPARVKAAKAEAQGQKQKDGKMEEKEEKREREHAEVLFKCARMTFGFDHLLSFMQQDPIYEVMIQMYCSTDVYGTRDVFILPNEWNDMRKKVILKALKEELYPMFWAEVQAKLAKQAEAHVLKKCKEHLTRIIDVRPYQLTAEEYKDARDRRITNMFGVNVRPEDVVMPEADDVDWKREKESREAGIFSVMVLVPDVGEVLDGDRANASENITVALINGHGDPIDMRVMFKDFYEKLHDKDQFVQVSRDPRHAYAKLKLAKRLEHLANFKKMLIRHSPAVILVLAGTAETKRMALDLEKMLDDEDLISAFVIPPKVVLGDPAIPRIVAYNERLKAEGAYADCGSPQMRMAISAARFLQDPLAETCQLWHEDAADNGVLAVGLHRLQKVVPKERLMQALQQPFMETVAKAGLHVNKIRRSQHLTRVAIFAPGLGPRKAKVFRKLILNDAIVSRQDFADRLTRFLNVGQDIRDDSTRSVVALNVLPFLKIQPDLRDTPDLAIRMPGLDMTRLGSAFAPWIEVLCKEGMMKHDEDLKNEIRDTDFHGDFVKLALNAQKTSDVVSTLSTTESVTNFWPQKAGQPEPKRGGPNVYDWLLEEFQREIEEPFQDKRQAHQKLSDEVAFFITVGATADSFKKGALMNAVVREDQEYNKDTGDKTGERQEVKCTILGGTMSCNFKKKMGNAGFADAGAKYFEGCDRRFLRDEPVLVRISHVNFERGKVDISVDGTPEFWEEAFPVKGEDMFYFLPEPREMWTTASLGLCGQTKSSQLKDWVTRPRNIKHPNWKNASHGRAVSIIDTVPLHNVLFRPSQRNDLIVALLKVHETMGPEAVDPKRCFRTFDVYEKGEKSITKGFEISTDLEVDGAMYYDLDEVIARHMDPVAEHLRLLQEHFHYGLQNGCITEKQDVMKGLTILSEQDRRMLYYCFLTHDYIVGHGMLLWVIGGKLKEEFIEVTPKGYRLWGQPFDNLKTMMKWFKSTGWRNSTRCRKEFREDWKQRCALKKDRRGLNVREAEDEAHAKAFDGNWAKRSKVSGGLNTPTMAAPTPTLYQNEMSAMTPGGLATPHGAPATPSGGFSTPAMSGFRTPQGAPATPGARGGMTTPSRQVSASMTPAQLRHPGTPGVSMAAPSTPVGAFAQHGRNPATPGALLQAGSRTPAGPPPATPHGIGAPMTPAQMAARSLRGPGSPGAMPMTPAQMASRTPGGAAPSTPMHAFAASRTPRGAPPQTPAGIAAARGSQTPSGPPPMTPVAAMQRGPPVAGTPMGPPPMTPFGLGTRSTSVPTTPGGAGLARIPTTPSGAFVNRGPPGAPSTPGFAAPSTPAAAFAYPQTPGLGTSTPQGGKGRIPSTPQGGKGAVPTTPAGAGPGPMTPGAPGAVPTTPAGAAPGAIPSTPKAAPGR